MLGRDLRVVVRRLVCEKWDGAAIVRLKGGMRVFGVATSFGRLLPGRWARRRRRRRVAMRHDNVRQVVENRHGKSVRGMVVLGAVTAVRVFGEVREEIGVRCCGRAR